MDLEATRGAMLGGFRARGPVLVAYSGGVDSGLVAKLAHDALDGGALAVIADSESLSRLELAEARAGAEAIGIPLRVVPVSELESAAYAANPTNRCYFCRAGLAGVLTDLAAAEGFRAIADGVNLSDLGDVRPGIRAMARSVGLSFWDKPSNACLSSRIPHGTAITLDLLRRVEAAEDYVRGRGFRQVRVRHEGTIARIEVPPEDIPRPLDLRGEIESAIVGLGYRQAVVDPVGYRGLG